MKKLLLSLAILLTLTVGIHTPKANAFGIVNIIATGGLDYVGTPQTAEDMLMTVACIALLPLCILEEENPVGMDFETLLDQEYDEEEAMSILSGQETFLDHLIKKNQKVTSEGNLSAKELANIIDQEVPGIEDYTKFVRENY